MTISTIRDDGIASFKIATPIKSNEKPTKTPPQVFRFSIEEKTKGTPIANTETVNRSTPNLKPSKETIHAEKVAPIFAPNIMPTD